MNFKRLMIVIGAVVLVAVITLSWGCQNQPTGPETKITPSASSKTRGTGSCTAGSFKVSFSGATFVAGLGWSTGTSRTISYSGSCSGCNNGPGVYGWLQNPLVEYYVGNGGGTSKGSYSCNGRTYTVYTATRTNAPSIEGTKTFTQYNAGGSNASPVDMGCHFDAWRSKGLSIGSQNLQVVSVESWSNGSGSASVSVPNSNWYTLWIASGSATFTCGGGGGSTTSSTTTSGGSSTTTTSGGSSTTTSGGWWWSSTTTSGGSSTTTTSGGGSTTTSGSGSNTIVVRARGTNGDEHIKVLVGDNSTQIGSWTLSTSYANYSASTSVSSGVAVVFDNDGTNRDVQIDYITYNGSTRQAEDQSTNTGVWQNSQCGGSKSEWLHCNGYIGF